MSDPSIERFKRVVAAAYGSLEARRQEVNDLNVFPVADGDTGDNMARTMYAVLVELDRIAEQEGEEVDRNELVHAVARAALMGARGNSGVILSQIVRGAAEYLATRPGDLISPVLLSSALSSAADAAYESVRDPTEGTMLTVIRAMSNSASMHLARLPDANRILPAGLTQEQQDEILAGALEVITEAGRQAVLRTTGQLDVLAAAGVVDAGAHGLVLIMAGMVAGLRGQETPDIEIPEQAPARISAPEHVDSRFRYCVNFIVEGEALDGPGFEASLREIGDSVLIVGDRRTLRVHVHTDEPPLARAVFEGHGEVSQVDEADMRAQIAERERLAGGSAHRRPRRRLGDGMRQLYEGLGAVIRRRPDHEPLDRRARRFTASPRPARRRLVLPNSPNVVLAARHAAELEHDARIINCTSQQAGLAALVEVDGGAAIDENLERIDAALAEIGQRDRSGRQERRGRPVRPRRRGQFSTAKCAPGGGAGSTLREILGALAAEAEIITIIEGESAPIALDEVAALAPDRSRCRGQQGGQPRTW